MWVFFLLIANLGIMWLEYVYRVGLYPSFFKALPYIIVPILMGQFGLFYGFKLAPSLFVAGAVFTLVNVLLRIVNTYHLGETMNTYTWLGVVALIISIVLFKM